MGASMKSLTTPDFWAAYAKLPNEIRVTARAAYRIWQNNPRHPSLHFKKVDELWSVRIGRSYRALALLEGDTYFWFWIGTHDEYEQLLAE